MDLNNNIIKCYIFSLLIYSCGSSSVFNIIIIIITIFIINIIIIILIDVNDDEVKHQMPAKGTSSGDISSCPCQSSLGLSPLVSWSYCGVNSF